MTSIATAEPAVRLTQYARCAGCAAKMGAADLSKVLAGSPGRTDPRLLVGHETFDDAGVVLISEGVALVQTVDFFAPIVDDPYTFGRIAATNALSDVYAMGGEPLTALNIAGFPEQGLSLDVLRDILRGGRDACAEAGALVVGGHTILDEEVKFGLAVTGRVDPAKMLTNAAAQVGDVLVLTKGIGTGLLATAGKRGKLSPAHEASMVASMTTLNGEASRAAVAVGARCATDVTGFALLGHASHIARASNVTLVIRCADVPLLPGAREALQAGMRTGGGERNAAYLEGLVDWGTADEVMRAILLDPQTSGGLLVAVPAARVADYCSRMPTAVVIGEVVERRTRPIVVA
jgi:selenide,water dikinase